MDPKKPTKEEIAKLKEEKKEKLLDNKDLTQEEKQRLRKEKKEAAKRAKKELALKKKKEKANEESKGQGKNKGKGKKSQDKNNKGKKEFGAFGKPKQSTPRRDRADSAHDLPSGMDNVSVTIDEIMNKYYGRLHHAVVDLGLQLVSEKLTGASLRCLGIIKALIKYIKDYNIEDTVRIEEDFPKRIKQIAAFLRRCKPFTSGIELTFDHIIEQFTEKVGKLNEEIQSGKKKSSSKTETMKKLMVEELKSFANLNIINANQVICVEAVNQIRENEVVLTYGSNYTIRCVFLEAIEQGISFKAIVVGQDENDKESHELVELLASKGLNCVYCQLNSISLVARKVSKVFFGGISMMNNGYLVAKSGTASVACWAKSKMIPVVVCIESFKFSKKAVVHSLVTSELKDDEDGFKGKLNNKYDITPSKFIDMVVCESGCIPAVSVSIIRDKPQ